MCLNNANSHSNASIRKHKHITLHIQLIGCSSSFVVVLLFSQLFDGFCGRLGGGGPLGGSSSFFHSFLMVFEVVWAVAVLWVVLLLFSQLFDGFCGRLGGGGPLGGSSSFFHSFLMVFVDGIFFLFWWC
eukprot:503684_1